MKSGERTGGPGMVVIFPGLQPDVGTGQVMNVHSFKALVLPTQHDRDKAQALRTVLACWCWVAFPKVRLKPCNGLWVEPS